MTTSISHLECGPQEARKLAWKSKTSHYTYLPTSYALAYLLRFWALNTPVTILGKLVRFLANRRSNRVRAAPGNSWNLTHIPGKLSILLEIWKNYLNKEKTSWKSDKTFCLKAKRTYSLDNLTAHTPRIILRAAKIFSGRRPYIIYKASSPNGFYSYLVVAKTC